MATIVGYTRVLLQSPTPSGWRKIGNLNDQIVFRKHPLIDFSDAVA